VSNTNAFEDLLTQATELTFKDSTLALKADTNALALGMKIHHLAEASAGAGAVVVKMETSADQDENKIYSLVSASLDVNGLAVSSDANVKLAPYEAAHKATVTMNKDGLAASGTTTLTSPLTLENTFNAGLDATQATLSTDTKAALNDIKVENHNALTVTLSSLALSSKAEAVVSESTSYTHDIVIDLKPYTASANVNNLLKVMDVNLVNEAHLMAELYKLDLTGSLKALYGEEEIKHTYEINAVDMTATAKCSTLGKVWGTQMSHNTELEVVGLAARIQNDARFNSQPLRFDQTIRASVIPFDLNLDAIFNADGDLTLYGKQSAQLYGKFLLKAQPLALASAHECRASVTQQLDNGFALETTVDSKMDALVTPQEQKAHLLLKSKLNNQALNQEVNVYNTAERLGLELSGTLLSDLLNVEATEAQEFTISGFVKYDKNAEMGMIQLPLLQSLPVILENVKLTVVSMAEALQTYLADAEVQAKLAALPQQLTDVLVGLHLEDKVVALKAGLISLTQEYVITMEDLETTLVNLKAAVEALLADVAARAQVVVAATKEMILSGTLSETVIANVNAALTAFYEEYDIRAMVVAVIDTIQELINQIDMEKLKDSSIAFLQDLEIKAKVDQILAVLKSYVEAFDAAAFLESVKGFIASLNLEAHVEELMAQIPTEMIANVIESVKAVIADFDIIGKVNALHAKLREIIVKLEADKKVEAILEQIVVLVQSFKIDETGCCQHSELHRCHCQGHASA